MLISLADARQYQVSNPNLSDPKVSCLSTNIMLQGQNNSFIHSFILQLMSTKNLLYVGYQAKN